MRTSRKFANKQAHLFILGRSYSCLYSGGGFRLLKSTRNLGAAIVVVVVVVVNVSVRDVTDVSESAECPPWLPGFRKRASSSGLSANSFIKSVHSSVSTPAL